jgi:CRP-like cAMP-binding protein
LKGVGHDGNYYRLKIPPRQSTLPNIPKLPKGTPMPKPLTPPPKPPETVADIKGFRKKFKSWFKDNIPVMILNFGSFCTLMAFTRSDVLELRSLAVTGQLCFVVYQLKQQFILWPSIMWSSTFACVNGYNIQKILEERHSSVNLTEEQERVFVDFFMPSGITPKQFERIYQKAKIFKLKKGELLIRKGDKLDHVYLIVKGSTQAHILGRRLTAASTNSETRGGQKEGGDSGAWAGEMAFLKRFWEKEQGKISVPENTPLVQQPDEGKSTIVEEASKHISTRAKEPLVNQTKSSGQGGGEPALYTIMAAKDCTVMSWTHEDLEELMESSVDLRSAMTRAMSTALVGKVVNLTISRAHQGKAPWLAWFTERPPTDGDSTTSVQVSTEHRLAEDVA